MLKNIRSLSAVIAVSLFCENYAIAVNDGSNAYTDPKLEIFNVQIVGPNGTISNGIQPKDSRFVTKKALFPNYKVLKQNSEVTKTASGGYFFEFVLPEGVDFTRKEGNYVVKSSDKVWNLATTTKSNDVTIHQQIAAIYRKNLRCFPNGKLILKTGCQIELPTPEQAKAEDIKISARLNKEQGVQIGDYTYALTNCPHGVCQQKKIERSTAKDDNKKIASDSEKITFEQNHIASVEYYKSNKDLQTERKIDELVPVTTVNLVDNTVQDNPNAQEQPKNQNVVIDSNSPVVVKGTTLTFSGSEQTVKAKNKKGEILAEAVQNYDEHIEKLKQQMNQQSVQTGNVASNAKMNQEYQELKNEIAELKQLLRENAQRPAEVKEDKESEFSFFTLFIGLILVALAGTSLFFFAKIRNMSRADDLLDEDDKNSSLKDELSEDITENEDNDLLANQVGEDNSEEIIAEQRAKILDARLKQESVVTSANELVNAAAQNDQILNASSLSEREVVINNFSNRVVEKVEVENNSVDESVRTVEIPKDQPSSKNDEQEISTTKSELQTDNNEVSQPKDTKESKLNSDDNTEIQVTADESNSNLEINQNIDEDAKESTNLKSSTSDIANISNNSSNIVNFEFDDNNPITVEGFEVPTKVVDYGDDVVETINPDKDN